jgi:hypothetical protein
MKRNGDGEDRRLLPDSNSPVPEELLDPTIGWKLNKKVRLGV